MYDRKKWIPFEYSDGMLTVYNGSNIDTANMKDVPVYEFCNSSKYLVGIESKINKVIVFFVESLPAWLPWSSSTREVYYCFSLSGGNNYFAGISFHCKELEYFCDPFNAINLDIKHDPFKVSIIPKNYDENLKTFDFGVNEIQVKGEIITLSRIYHHSPTPLKIKTYIKLSFQETNDMEFKLSLYNITMKFIYFIVQRKNIKFDDIKLYQNNINATTKELYSESLSLEFNRRQSEVSEELKVLEKTLPFLFIEKRGYY